MERGLCEGFRGAGDVRCGEGCGEEGVGGREEGVREREEGVGEGEGGRAGDKWWEGEEGDREDEGADWADEERAEYVGCDE